MEEILTSSPTQQAGLLAGQLAQVQADLVKLTVELLESQAWIGHGIRSPEHWLQIYTGLSRAQCLQLVRIAERAADLPATVELMTQGRLTADQAGPIAAHVPAWAEDRVLKLAELATASQVNRTVSQYNFEPPPTPHDEPAPPPQSKPAELSMYTRDGRFRLRFEADAAAGELVEKAIREAKDALFNAGNDKATLADGLVEVSSRSLGSITSTSRYEHHKILIHLDVNGNGWFNKKGALPEELLRHLTCDGRIRPIHETGATPVAIGRAHRIVPERVRALIEDRDRGCRYPGCQATAFLENHHIQHWADGGPTVPENLISLCPWHHKKHHLGEFGITGDPTRPGDLTFTNTFGHPIAKDTPLPLPPPPLRDAPIRQGIRGESIDAASVHFGYPPQPHPPDPETPAAAAA